MFISFNFRVRAEIACRVWLRDLPSLARWTGADVLVAGINLGDGGCRVGLGDVVLDLAMAD